ncbi:exodeoxyribonuclease V beta subunit [Filimonas zeae]|uniref:RecBCD enzyme subunit RecB n=1 Tax=Filimonas zeae TaxID=1737353 RepID=A0A917MRG6_9BACT|nr:UvrD-helicase domain-containing protein [Filimonas zeae]MDR6337643.1 exodeoxyribonuclease V beta subunit [Filimonas zeae]GGH59607.1 RecBCD enzyme subunit RecB [Filimonas zeae]
MKTNLYQHFEAATVPLEGSNLIEASAGTGKTYSIAILALRLVLEKKIPVKEILMVTFTKAAVAELHERVRLFMRTAYKACEGKPVKDANIQQLVEKAIAADGVQNVQQRLRDAVLLLDETAVFTIHSFCQQTLTEFAFETNQLFGTEMVQNAEAMIEEEVHEFWRTHITTLPVALLNILMQRYTMEALKRLVKEDLGGKKYMNSDGMAALSATELDAMQQQIAAAQQQCEVLTSQIRQYITANAATLKEVCATNTYAKKSAQHLIDTPDQLITFINSNRDKAYVGKVFGNILTMLEPLEQLKETIEDILRDIMFNLNCQAIIMVRAGVQANKRRNNLMGFDDMIVNLHKAITAPGSQRLVNVLRHKYKAVFVDEFQDTDRQQFDIFDKAFGEETILFYIGDPKQSIYAWRKADIFTYFKAREGVQRCYGMNRNFRSTPALIGAMNAFFVPAPGFDTFYFSDAEESIDYIPVEAANPKAATAFYRNGVEEAPVTVYSVKTREEIIAAAAAQVLALLQDSGYQVARADGTLRAITPSDIGVLVRKHNEGRGIKAQLAKLGIPAVAIDDAKVLHTTEAQYLLYLMQAMEMPDRSSINRALLSPFTGYTTQTILMLNDEVTLGLFGKYKTRWQEDGIYTALIDFTADFEVRRVLLQTHAEEGERIISNLFQLIELVHQVQSRKNLSAPELLSWLQKGIEGMETEGDEYEQRVESDEEAVKIVTIHKSKGLEYPIVIAPFLDFKNNNRDELVSFRHPQTGEYICAEKYRLSTELLESQQQQAEQENRRLLYVALTRAVYKCYIYKGTGGPYSGSTLSAFIQPLSAAPPEGILFDATVPESDGKRYRKNNASDTFTAAPAVQFSLQQQHWRKLSYSMLAASALKSPKSKSQPVAAEYDTFIFHTLKRGAKTGDLLHYIFERIHFGDDTRWPQVLDEAVRRYAPGQQQAYIPMLQQLLQQVLHTVIPINETTQFTLAQIAGNRRITEFEFDFPIQALPADLLNQLADEQTAIAIRPVFTAYQQRLEGIMNGMMDLFFEHDGKYYILDWKSNYLGSALEEYNTEAIAAAMNESNYHLQYFIYTLAAKKYLESRLPGFDYETQFGGVIYLFVRGMRNGNTTGIFYTRPLLDKISRLEKYSLSAKDESFMRTIG